MQTIRVGDMIITRDHGAQVVCWVGRTTVSAMGRYAPIRFREGAVGNVRDLLVSPQRRMLISGRKAELLFDAPEVLVAAKHMVNVRTVVKSPSAEVEYIHLMFERHEIIFAEGMAIASYYPGQG